MLPVWMRQMCTLPCAHCSAPLTSDNIDIVGIRRPEEWEAWRAEPVFVICLKCRNCGQQTNSLHRQPLVEAIAGVTAFSQLIEHECGGKEPLIEIPGMTTPKTKPATQPPEPESGGRTPLRPSRRRNQPVTPPTQAEIRAFLNRMRKTSFKRGSKGFRTWMKGFGVDADAPGDADGESR